MELHEPEPMVYEGHTHPMLMTKEDLDEIFRNWLEPELQKGMHPDTFRHLMSLDKEQKGRTLCVRCDIPFDVEESGLASLKFWIALGIAKANEKPCCEFC